MKLVSQQVGLFQLCICKKLTYYDYLNTYYEIKLSPPLPPSPGPLTGLLPAGPAPLPLLTPGPPSPFSTPAPSGSLHLVVSDNAAPPGLLFSIWLVANQRKP